MSETKPTPYVSDDDILQSDSRSPAFEVRDLYEARLSEVTRERDEAREKLRWIPVTDRLPEDDVVDRIVAYSKRVLVMNKFGFVYTSRMERWIDYNRVSWGDAQDVTHWMPLPEPPKTDDHAK